MLRDLDGQVLLVYAIGLYRRLNVCEYRHHGDELAVIYVWRIA